MLIEDDLLTLNQIKDVRNVITVLRSHQVLSEGKESGAGHKLERIITKLKEEKSQGKDKTRSEFGEGYRMGLSKAISVVKGEREE